MADIYRLESRDPDHGFGAYVEHIPQHVRDECILDYIEENPNKFHSNKHWMTTSWMFPTGGPTNPVEITVYKKILEDSRQVVNYSVTSNTFHIVVVHAMLDFHFRDRKHFHRYKLTYPQIAQYMV